MTTCLHGSRPRSQQPARRHLRKGLHCPTNRSHLSQRPVSWTTHADCVILRSAMTRDGRTLDYGTLETIRTIAVERVREGARPSEVIASYGLSSLHDLSLAHGGTWARPWTSRARGAAPPTNPDREAGATGVSLDQWEESTAIRVRVWVMDASDCARTDRAAIRRAVEPGLDWCGAGATRPDAAEAMAAGVSAGFRGE